MTLKNTDHEVKRYFFDSEIPGSSISLKKEEKQFFSYFWNVLISKTQITAYKLT